ncbi:AAA family ATPase [Aureimonas sp. SK2]|uniref:AAA family ATPase n=1 Tax=Aureimonas sp. SK2 TaxID=3015992 RepID=UPI00244514F5|nr:AAA family ATPase [Aureimonas sp. SK2]
MHIIGIAAQKGGAGKSTIAAHLAILADRDASPALLVDTDPQGSLVLWHRLRSAETPILAKAEAKTLPEILEAAKDHKVKWCIVDSAPHAASAISAVMKVADLVLIPSRPSAFDLGAIEPTLRQAEAMRARSLVVLNAVPPRRGFGRTTVEMEARAVLDSYSARVWSGSITQRAAFSSAISGGMSVDELEPGGAAAQEIGALWTTIKDELESK